MSALEVVTTVGAMSDEEHAAGHESGMGYRARRTAIGMSVSALAKVAGVDRGSLTGLEAGHEVRDTTQAAVERALRDLEHEMGMDVDTSSPAESSAQTPGFIKFTVTGVYGAKSLVVEGPVDNLPELEAAVDRILRRMQASED